MDVQSMFGILVWDTKPVRQAEKEKPIDFSTGFLISFWWEGGARFARCIRERLGPSGSPC
jgi:hypothetical protein